MSVTFSSDSAVNYTTVESCCLCAQMAEGWGLNAPTDETARAAVQAAASPDCGQCHGTGFEMVQEPCLPGPNFANANAVLILQALGFLPEGERYQYGAGQYDLCGSVSISDFRRTCVRALAKGNLPTREHEEYTMPARAVNGAIVRGCRVVSNGFDAEGLTHRIQTLLDFAAAEQAKGATVINWG